MFSQERISSSTKYELLGFQDVWQARVKLQLVLAKNKYF